MVAAGVVLGLLIGAGVALMLAPEVRSDARRAVGRKLRKARRRGADAWEDLRDELASARKRLRRARRRRLRDLDEVTEKADLTAIP